MSRAEDEEHVNCLQANLLMQEGEGDDVQSEAHVVATVN